MFQRPHIANIGQFLSSPQSRPGEHGACANIRFSSFGSDVVLFDVHCVIDRAVLFAISCVVQRNGCALLEGVCVNRKRHFICIARQAYLPSMSVMILTPQWRSINAIVRVPKRRDIYKLRMQRGEQE